MRTKLCFVYLIFFDVFSLCVVIYDSLFFKVLLALVTAFCDEETSFALDRILWHKLRSSEGFILRQLISLLALLENLISIVNVLFLLLLRSRSIEGHLAVVIQR